MSAQALGKFALSVMDSIARLKSFAWVANLHLDLSQKLNRTVSLPQLYSTLAKLERDKLVTFELMPAEPVRGGRAKRLFRLERDGEDVLDSAGYPNHVMVDGYDSMHTDDCPGCIDWARRMNEYVEKNDMRAQFERECG